jgi:hypothetical protein
MVAPSGPNLEMFVLDAMQDDLEDVGSIMRYLVEWRPHWPHDFTEDEVIQALRALIERELVDAYDEAPGSSEVTPVNDPAMDSASLRRYWFMPTAQGREVWKKWDAPWLPE